MRDEQSMWHLASGQALSLAPSGEVRRLAVEAGRVWLTLAGTQDLPAQDCWLERGDAVALAPGQSAVIEAWPAAADFQLLLPPASTGSDLARLRRRSLFGRRLLAG